MLRVLSDLFCISKTQTNNDVTTMCKTPTLRSAHPLESIRVKRDGTQGVLEIAFKKEQLHEEPLFFLFLIDVSASMDEDEKLICVQETLIHMIHMLNKTIKSTTTQVYLQVDTFSTSIHSIIPTTQITQENLAQLCDDIWRKIRLFNFTNFEVALRHAAQVLLQHRKDHPSHRMMHFFFTDGNANTGNVVPTFLATLVPPDIVGSYHFYMGIGEAHNSIVLHACAQNPRSEYWFISDSPHIQIVADEILHKILYSAAGPLKISVHDSSSALFYDWQNNTWSNTVSETHLLDSDMTKRIHVRWNILPDKVISDYLRIMLEIDDCIFGIDIRIVKDPKAIVYIFQQQLMHLLFRCQKYAMKVLQYDDEDEDDDEDNDDDPDNSQILQKQLSALHRRLKNFPLDHPLLEVLQQDCKYAFEKLGTYSGILFSNSRLTFFGVHQVYTPRSESKKRKCIQNDGSEKEDHEDNASICIYNISQDNPR